MDEQIISNFYFNKYHIDDISFKLNKKFKSGKINIDMKSKVEVSINPKENKGNTSITLIIWDEEENKPFGLTAKITGFFSADDEMDHDEFAHMCKYNGSSILFPFLRSAITDITKAANVRPLMLPLINISSYIAKQDSKENNGEASKKDLSNQGF